MRISDWCSDVCSSDLALEQAVGEGSGLQGYEQKRVMRTGTVASVDNRNWELSDNAAIIGRRSQSRAVALDMESRSEGGRVGQEWVRTRRHRWGRYNEKTRESNSRKTDKNNIQ